MSVRMRGTHELDRSTHLTWPAASNTTRVHSTLLRWGAKTLVHTHSDREVFYIVDGEQCLATQETAHRLRVGQSFVLPHDTAPSTARRSRSPAVEVPWASYCTPLPDPTALTWPPPRAWQAAGRFVRRARGCGWGTRLGNTWKAVRQLVPIVKSTMPNNRTFKPPLLIPNQFGFLIKKLAPRGRGCLSS